MFLPTPTPLPNFSAYDLYYKNGPNDFRCKMCWRNLPYHYNINTLRTRYRRMPFHYSTKLTWRKKSHSFLSQEQIEAHLRIDHVVQNLDLWAPGSRAPNIIRYTWTPRSLESLATTAFGRLMPKNVTTKTALRCIAGANDLNIQPRAGTFLYSVAKYLGRGQASIYDLVERVPLKKDPKNNTCVLCSFDVCEWQGFSKRQAYLAHLLGVHKATDFLYLCTNKHCSQHANIFNAAIPEYCIFESLGQLKRHQSDHFLQPGPLNTPRVAYDFRYRMPARRVPPPAIR